MVDGRVGPHPCFSMVQIGESRGGKERGWERGEDGGEGCKVWNLVT